MSAKVCTEPVSVQGPEAPRPPRLQSWPCPRTFSAHRGASEACKVCCPPENKEEKHIYHVMYHVCVVYMYDLAGRALGLTQHRVAWSQQRVSARRGSERREAEGGKKVPVRLGFRVSG